MESGGERGGDRLERDRAWDRHVPQKLAGPRVGDDGALVADDRIVDPRLLEIGEYAAEHAARDDDHVRPCGADAPDRLARVRSQHRVLRDEGAVEIDREGGDVRREGGRELEPDCYGVPPVDLTT